MRSREASISRTRPSGRDQSIFVPGAADDAELQRWWNRYSRLSAIPAMYIALMKTNGATDVRDVLPAIDVPTLVLHRKHDHVIDVRSSRYVADRIPGAKLIELPGSDHWPWIGDTQTTLAEIQEFLVGTRPKLMADRFLTTVLFTDIVNSTEKASALGDGAWSDLLDLHDAFSRDLLNQFGGEWVKNTGDGILATFDGPGRAIECAKRLLRRASELGFQLRAGSIPARPSDVGTTWPAWLSTSQQGFLHLPAPTRSSLPAPYATS